MLPPCPDLCQDQRQAQCRDQRSMSASTRAGDPEPPTIGNGPAITTAPVGGSRRRFCSWVSPYLSLPISSAWQGNIGSNPAAAPASVPTVSTPIPTTGDSSATQRAHSADRPGECGPASSALVISCCECERASQPVRTSIQPPA